MTLIISLPQFNTYFSQIWNDEGISNLTDDQKTKLIYSSQYLIIQNGYNITSATVNDNLISAICETAKYIYKYDNEIFKRMAIQSMGIKDFSIDKFKENYKETSLNLPMSVIKLLDSINLYNKGIFTTISRT